MLKLVITDSPAEPDRPLASDQVSALRDRMGNVCAYTYTVDGEHRIDLPKLASFRFTATGGEVTAVAAPAVRKDWIVDAYRRTVLPLALQAQGSEVLHASAVLANETVVALCGKSGAGKSTLAFALRQRGYPIWADDAVTLSVGEDGVDAVPIPFKVRLKAEAATLFGAEPPAGETVAILETEGPSLRPTPLSTVVVLERYERTPAEKVIIRPLAPSEALTALLIHAFSFSEHDERPWRRTALHYLDVAARVSLFELRVPAGLERLNEIVDTLERLISSVPTASPAAASGGGTDV